MSELIDRREFPEVLPCPFCGSKPKFFIMKRKRYVDIYYIECVNRKCNEPYSKAYDEEEVVKKWNTRHYPAEVQILIDEAKPRKLIASSYDKDIVFCPRCREAYSLKKIRSLCAEVDKSECPRCKQALDWGEE